MVIGGGSPLQHPRLMKCYTNQQHIDFTNISSIRPVQEFNLAVNTEGTNELITVIHPFTMVNTIAFYFPKNYGTDEGDDDISTIIQYIGLQGEHTHYQRRAVDTMYEVLCNGQELEGSIEEH